VTWQIRLLEIVIVTLASVLGALSVSLLHNNQKIKDRIYRYKVKPVYHSIESAQHELESLKLERDAMGDKITRVYEAKNKGVIDSYDLDRIVLSCRKQLRTQNLRIHELEEINNYSEILKLRSELVGMLETRISNIDTKLKDLSSKLIINSASKLETDALYIDMHNGNKKEESTLWTSMGTHMKDKHLAKEYSYAKEQVQKMEQEIVKALTELEESPDPQIKIKLENNHTTDEKINPKKMRSGDALSFCNSQFVKYE